MIPFQRRTVAEISSQVPHFSYGNQIITFPRKKVQWHKRGFVQSVSPIYFFSRAIGLMPFTIAHERNSKILRAKVTALDFVWFVIAMIVHISFVVIWYRNLDYKRIKNVSNVVPIGMGAHATFGLIYSVICVAMDMCNRCKFVDLLRSFMTFDKEVRNYRINMVAYLSEVD